MPKETSSSFQPLVVGKRAQGWQPAVVDGFGARGTRISGPGRLSSHVGW